MTLDAEQSSKKRMVGSAIFGLLSAGYLLNAANFTIPRILSAALVLDAERAQSEYDSLGLLRLSVFIVTALAGAITAGFLSRRKGVFAGLLSNSFYIAVFFYFACGEFSGHGSGVAGAALSFGLLPPKFELIAVLSILLLVGSIGGLIGSSLYSPAIDLDFGKQRVTIFGVRWWHYVWILPFVYYCFLASLIMVIYAWVKVIWVDFSYAWHPSLWFSISEWFLLVLGFALVYAAAYVAIGGLIRFYRVMQYGESAFKGWGKFGRVFLYGVGAPALSFPLATLAADAARAMPKPASGDWKVAVGFVAFFFLIAIISSLYSWLRKSKRPFA